MEKTGITTLEGSQVAIKIEVPADEFSRSIEDVLAETAQTIHIDGFRKGTAPLAMVRDRIGEGSLLEQAARRAVKKYYPEILHKYKIHAIGKPEITITKLAPDNPLEFTAKTAVYPDAELPDYKKIAAGFPPPKTDTAATDEEIAHVLESLRARVQEKNKKGADETRKSTSHVVLDDAFAQSLGNFQTLAELTETVKRGIETDKKRKEVEKRRLAIMDEIGAHTRVTIPEVLIDSELDRMVSDLTHNVTGTGIDFSAYLRHIKKSEEDLRGEWRKTAASRVKTNIVLSEIIRKEKIVPHQDAVSKEVAHIREHVPDADEEHMRNYAEQMVAYEQAYQLLETQYTKKQ